MGTKTTDFPDVGNFSSMDCTGRVVNRKKDSIKGKSSKTPWKKPSWSYKRPLRKRHGGRSRK